MRLCSRNVLGLGGITPCPGCGDRGRAVSTETVRSFLPPEGVQALVGLKPRFCLTPGCSIFYYGADSRAVTITDALVPIGLKDSRDLAPLCYCLGITRGQLRAEVEGTGSSTAPDRIEAEMRAGRCRCELRNPSGTYCLGLVRSFLRELKATPGRKRVRASRRGEASAGTCAYGPRSPTPALAKLKGQS